MAQHRRGGADPTWRRTTRGWFRCAQTPQGPSSLFVEARDAAGEVRAQAWGAGAAWALEQLPHLLGAHDTPPVSWAPHPVVDEALRARPHWRRAGSGLVLQDLVPTVIEQKVTGQEAFGSYRSLVLRHGRRAPGPAGERGLLVPPTDQEWAVLPSWAWLGASVDHARAGALTQALARGASLQRAVLEEPTQAEHLLTSVPGIGRWSAAEIRQRSLGDADAVSYFDYHVAKDFGWAVSGVEFTDAELETFLEPWAGFRGRVVTLVRAQFGGRPRHGARMAPRRHMPDARRW